MISITPAQPIAFTVASLPFIVAAFHGFMLAALLWFHKSSTGNNEYTANRLLAGLLLVLSVMLVDNAVDYSGHYYYAPFLIDTVVPLYFLVGPLLWAYVKAQTSPATLTFRPVHLLHLLPALLQLVVLLPFILNTEHDAKIIFFYEEWFDLLPIEDDAQSLGSCIWYQFWQWHDCTITLKQIVGQPEFDLHLKSPLTWVWLSDIEEVALWTSLIAYIGGVFKLLNRHRRNLQQLTSNTQAKDLRWLSKFIFMVAIAAGVYIVFSFQETMMETTWLEHDKRAYITYLMLAVGIIFLGVLSMRQPIIFSDELRLIDDPTSPVGSSGANEQSGDSDAIKIANDSSPSKYRNSPLTLNTNLEIKAILEEHLTTHKHYLNPDLSLKELSDQLGLRPHYVSQVINETIGMNFFDFVNGYRLQEVKRQLRLQDRKPILQIATDSGFNSKTSFYAFFRKREGMSPSAWRKSLDAD